MGFESQRPGENPLAVVISILISLGQTIVGGDDRCRILKGHDDYMEKVIFNMYITVQSPCLDTMQFKSEIREAILRRRWEACGVKTIVVPWDHE